MNDTLSDLLAEVKNEMVQEAWDRELLSAWRSSKYLFTVKIIDQFQHKHKLTREEFYKLKRVPRYPRHYQNRMPRFIAAYLPALNDKLFDAKLSDDELVVWMQKVNLDTENIPADAYKVAAENRARKKSIDELAANKVATISILENNKQHGRNWSTVKSVRGKP